MILLDTGFLFAFLNKDDAHHAEASATMAGIADGEWGQPLVSDLVVAELFNLLRARKMPPEMERNAGQILLGESPLLEPVRSITAPSAAEAGQVFALYRKHRQLSFTDAVILDEVQRRPTSRLATFDSGFKGLCDIIP
ncbi:MAG: PIN domain-containing protein [Candidatus Thermoplasmatota archaeon]